MSKDLNGKKTKPPEIDVYFDGRDGGYFYMVKDRFLKLGARDVRMHLRTRGLSDLYCPAEWKAPGLREVDYPLYRAQMDRLVDYAGSLAGHRTGVYKNSSGRVFLVTEEANSVFDGVNLKAKHPDPKWFISFVQELLPGDQWLYFCHWLKISLASLQRGDFRSGQVVVLAGPSECGKSLMQDIVTLILGGRCANPFRYMMGETQFNADLAWGEHWKIEDPASTTDIRTRRLFGAKLKECTVNSEFSIHQKGKDALLLKVFRRVTISVNDEPENLSVIPPMDDSIKEKIFLFRCAQAVKSFEQFSDEKGEQDRLAVNSKIESELKQIRHWLLNLPQMHADFRNVRFGIEAWHHPELLAVLEDLSPEARLLTLIDEAIFKNFDPEDIPFFEGKAIEVEKSLRDSKFTFEADKILRYNGACGAYLGRLAKSHPERISKRLKNGYAFWTITKPLNQEV